MLGKKMVLLFVARSNSYKTRRQLVHCRIDVVTTRRNVVVNPSYLVQNSQTTRVCRIDVVTTRRNVEVNPSYLGNIPYHVAASRTGPVITCTMSPWSTGGQEHARSYDKRRNVYENCTKITGELRDQHEKSSAHFGWRVVARFLNRLKIS